MPDARIQQIERLQKQAAAQETVIQLGGGLPAAELLPADELAAAFRQAVRDPDTSLQYGWSEGLPQVRRWVAERLRARGAAVGEDEVVITAGAQQALALATSELFGDPDRTPRIQVGAASYPSALHLFRLRGAQPVRDVRDADVLYLMPGVMNPTGEDGVPDPDAVLAFDRPLIVDEAYTELRFDGVTPAPLLGRARDRVWHVGTVSKTICPGLRVGWLVPPPARLAAVLERKQAVDLQAGSLAQAVLARFVASFDYDAHVAGLRRAYRERADRLVAALCRHAPTWQFREPEGGFAVFVTTDAPIDGTRFLAAAIEHGVCVDPGCLFLCEPGEPLSFRASFSSAPIDQLEEGVRRLVAAAHAVGR